METAELVLQKLKNEFTSIDFEVSDFRNELTLKFPKENIVEVCNFIKTDSELQFVYCEDITAVLQ